MDRRTLLQGTVLVGGGLLAGCTGGDDPDGGDSPATGVGTDSSTTGSESDATTTRTGTDATTETLSESEVVELSGPPCEALAGATFRSVEKRDGGMGPEGTPVRVHWQVRFEDGEYHYSHGDVIESGEYTCRVENGAASVEGSTSSDLTYSGRYDPESGVLSWDGTRYRPVERS